MINAVIIYSIIALCLSRITWEKGENLSPGERGFRIRGLWAFAGSSSKKGGLTRGANDA
jgi:hypothetical protein